MGLLDVFFPSLCLQCRTQRRTRLGLCSRCLDQLEETGLQACIRCGRICGGQNCAPLEHRYSRVLSLAHYAGPWRKVVQAAKFGRDKSAAMELARELAKLAKAAGFARPEAVVPAPSASRHWRYYDLTILMGKVLSEATGAPLRRVLVRRPGRMPQVMLNRRQRLEGLEAYIYLPADTAKFKGGVVWLVDDVYTTGATADACAGALLAAGARSVYLIVLGA